MKLAFHGHRSAIAAGHTLDPRMNARNVVRRAPPIPDYLAKHYWWAYVDPLAVQFWDRVPLVNLILYGNYSRLRDQALEALGADLSGRTLQMTCCYGNFTPKLAEGVARSGGADPARSARAQASERGAGAHGRDGRHPSRVAESVLRQGRDILPFPRAPDRRACPSHAGGATRGEARRDDPNRRFCQARALASLPIFLASFSRAFGAVRQ